MIAELRSTGPLLYNSGCLSLYSLIPTASDSEAVYLVGEQVTIDLTACYAFLLDITVSLLKGKACTCSGHLCVVKVPVRYPYQPMPLAFPHAVAAKLKDSQRLSW